MFLLKVLVIFLIYFSHTILTQINVGSIPTCARSCLYGSAYAVKLCNSVDVYCLCNDESFVSAVSCCLATNCTVADQALSIQFNQEQCASVNASAPGFVGCSPSGLKSASQPAISATVGAGTQSSATASGVTVTRLETQPASYVNTDVSTAAFDGRSLLTQSCTVPYFALATSGANIPILYPQVGCASDRPGCCPYTEDQHLVLQNCPQDYFTTAGGCCPTGYSVYNTQLGLETPCYSPVSTALIPGTTPTVSGLAVITDRAFTRKYALAPTRSSGFAPGSIAGVTIGSVAAVAGGVGLLFWILKRNKKELTSGTASFPPTEPVLPPMQENARPQELPDLQKLGSSRLPTDAPIHQGIWPLASSSPPAYEGTKPRPVSVKVSVPHELPGSITMHEHHPAFSDTGSEGTLKTPPTRSPHNSFAGTPLVSPAMSPALPPTPAPVSALDGNEVTGSVSRADEGVSPLNSPKFKKQPTG